MTIDQPANITPGDIYEDCAFHPVLCTHNDGEVVMGIALIDASTPRCCDLKHCGVVKLSITDVIAAPCLPVRVGRRAASSLADSGAGGRSR